MKETFLCADLHFGHKGMCSFMNRDGTKLRPWATPEEMDEALVSKWNAKVPPSGKVYVLGDVVINRRCLPTLSRLNGTLILIKGNHDVFRLEEYTPYFKDIMGSHVLHGSLLTHIPVHPSSLARWGSNIHGHLHSDVVRLEDGSIDTRYLCVSMEHIDFAPIALDEVGALKNRQHQVKYGL